jgi:hypothetical protein
MLLGKPFFFLFWDNHISIFLGIFGEMAHNIWSIYLVDEWSVLIPSVGILQWMWSVCDLDQESIKSISLGHNNLAKLNEIASSICIGFSMYMAYGSGRTFSIIEELVFPFLF